MDLDTRAWRAADGVRASAQGVDPMAQITELRREKQARRRSQAVAAVVGTVLVVAGAGWLVGSQVAGRADSPPPASTVATPLPGGGLKLGPSVGSHMNPPIEAHAPKQWVVDRDSAPYVRLTRGSMTIEIQGPIISLIEPTKWGANYPPIGPAGYAHWLRSNGARVVVLDDRTVMVDGEEVPQLTLMVRESPWYLGYAGTRDAPTLNEGDVVTITVIEVRGETILVASFGAESDGERAELRAATELVLSTMRLPE